VLCAEAAVGQEPFFVHLADDLIEAEVPCLKQMAGTFAFHRGSVLGVEEVPRRDTDKYGIVEVDAARVTVSRIRSIVEKPKPANAPSTLAVVGRYVLTAGIFEQLRQVGHGAGGEIQLTDGIARLLNHEAVYAHRFAGKRFDCGSKLGYLQATVEYALAHPGLSRSFRSYLLRLTEELAGSGATVRKGATRKKSKGSTPRHKGPARRRKR
jgi:UTP--glucose-1-phosphate uridylyltransferase